MSKPDRHALEATLSANLNALEALSSQSAQTIRPVAPPPSAELTTGRDGSPTWRWKAASGKLCWLGRTTMPSVSAGALVEAFDPGQGNTLLAGIGSGHEIALLLKRLQPHQAVMVVESDPAVARLVLTLHDFATALRAGRLVVFTGGDPWRQLAEFLVNHPGYLTPERILGWPWFEPDDIRAATARLHEIGGAVAQPRANRLADPATFAGPAPSAPTGGSIAVVSNLTDEIVRVIGNRIAAAARQLGRPCGLFTLDSPARVNPAAVEAELRAAGPTWIIALGVAPGALPYRLPTENVCIIWTHDHTPSPDWLRALPAGAVLAVASETVRHQLARDGFDFDRTLCLPPAAATCAVNNASREPRTGIALVGDLPAATARAVGLTLDSHRRLWNAAREILSARADRFEAHQADAVLTAAESATGISIDDAGVRNGIAWRIKTVLGPVIVRGHYAQKLLGAANDLALFGRGWENEKAFSPDARGPWPTFESVTNATDAPHASHATAAPNASDATDTPHRVYKAPTPHAQTTLADIGAMIVIDPSGAVPTGLLDGLAIGLVAFVRCNRRDERDDGLAAVLDPDRHVWRFQTAKELIELIERYRSDPAPFQDRANAAAQHIRANHTWRQRLLAIDQAFSAGVAGR